MPSFVSEAFADLYTSLGPGTDALAIRYYLGLSHGEPVAASMLALGAGVAGIYNVATIPEAQRKGFGSAITLTVLREARSLRFLGFGPAIDIQAPKGPVSQYADRAGRGPEEPQEEDAGCLIILVKGKQGFGGPKTGEKRRGGRLQSGNIFNQTGEGIGVDQALWLKEAQEKIEADGQKNRQQEEDILGSAGRKDIHQDQGE